MSLQSNKGVDMNKESSKLNFTKAGLDSLPNPPAGKRTYYYDTKARGLGISITSSGAKSFIVYRKVKGRPERVTLGRYPDLSIEQARGKAAEINAAIAKGENPYDQRRSERAEMTFGELFREFMERHSKLHKISWGEDERQFRCYLSHWNLRKLSSITKLDIQKLHQDVGRNNGHYAANRLFALLSSVFNKANAFGLWDKPNPCYGIKKFAERSRDRFLQSSELPQFFAALAEEPNETIRDYLLISLLTGARRANGLAMRWVEIDFENREWHIPRTKNHEPQTITLTDEAIMLLKKRRQAAVSEFVFPGTGRTGHLAEPKKGWARVLERAGLSNLHIHDLRRTLGSWQARTGASLVIIGKSLNHKSTQATAIYARLDLDPVRASVEKATSAMFVAAGLKQVETLQTEKN
jgi:integrase